MNGTIIEYYDKHARPFVLEPVVVADFMWLLTVYVKVFAKHQRINILNSIKCDQWMDG